MRATWIPFALVGALGCDTASTDDYFRFEIDQSWTYYLNEGGREDEVWTLEILDADDNEQSARGDFYFLLTQTYPNPEPALPDVTYPLRQFNFAAELEGTVENPTVSAWVYKWANSDEGLRNQDFVVPPGEEDSWSLSWESGSDSGTTEWTYDVLSERRAEGIQVPHGFYEDCIEVTRTITTTSTVGGEETETTQVRQETWANGVGLIRYHLTATDGTIVEGLLRETTAAERAGS